jgi:hypothetical protein
MSFFGFDTSKPKNPKLTKAEDFDELLEEKYKYAGEEDYSGALDDDDDQLNDTTFGDVDVNKISNPWLI